MNSKQNKLQWAKVYITDNASDENTYYNKLVGVLQNYAFLQYGSLPPHIIRVWLQHNRDIYYVTVNDFDPRDLDPHHLSKEEQLALIDVGYQHIINRIIKSGNQIPSWWEKVLNQELATPKLKFIQQ